jgi:hypothetical protein
MRRASRVRVAVESLSGPAGIRRWALHKVPRRARMPGTVTSRPRAVGVGVGASAFVGAFLAAFVLGCLGLRPVSAWLWRLGDVLIAWFL